MIVVYEASGDRVARLADAFLPHRLHVARDWREFERLAPSAVCSVVALEWLHEGEGPALLRRFGRRYPCHPVILVTRGCMDNARHLHHVMVEEVLWLADVERTLPAALRRIGATGPQQALASLLAGARHLPRSLREALGHACLAPRPVYSVADLAAAVHCDRTTLCLQWRKAVGPAAPLRLVDFLGLLLLVHASRRRLAGRKWQEVAGELDVHEHTLRRLSTRLVGSHARRSVDEDALQVTATLHAFVHGYLLPAAPAEDDAPTAA